MVSELSPDLRVGSRIKSDGYIATVRYIGEVPPTKGSWLGVEWDEKQGKHDGCHEGVRYFQTRSPTSGSFIRAGKVKCGKSFWTAAQDRYGEIQDDNAGINTEDMYVLGKNQQQTVVEIVGAKKLNKKQSKFDELTELCLGDKSISCSGDVERIQQSFPRVFDLDLQENLIPDWDTVARISQALPQLKILNVSKNRLPCPTNIEQLKPAFRNITTLFMSFMDYGWEEMKKVLLLFEQLETLHICWNRIHDVDTPTESLAKLKFLNLESNPLHEWKNALVFGQLQHLEALLLNDCGLSSLEFADVPHGEKTAHFPKLQQLAINRNKFTKWNVFDELNKLPCLNNLRIQHCPVTEPDDKYSESSIRYLIIARIENLQLLNRTVVDVGERKGAEVDYRKAFGLLWKDMGGHQDPEKNNPSKEFQEMHPRYQQLIDKYGAPEDSELKVQSSALKFNLISVNIVCPNLPDHKPITKKLPVTMIVQRVKVLAQRLLRIDPQAEITVTYATEKMPGKEIEMENDQKEIGYYAVEDGNTIYMRW